MQKPVLSKSSYVRGLQCHKSLYLYKKFYKLRDYISPEQLAKFKRGTDVGILAQQLFPGGKMASVGSYHFPYKNVEKTAQLIASGCKVIYEAAFIFNEVYIALDILVKSSETGWTAYEVKSSVQLSPTYYLDAALQHYVICNSGFALDDFVLIHINGDYIRQAGLDLQKLFSKKSILDFCEKQLGKVAENISEMKKMLEQPDIPAIDIGVHCSNPYPCDFSGFCRKNLPATGSVFELTDSTPEQQYELYYKGIKTLTDIPEGFALTKKQKNQLNAEEYIDKKYLQKLAPINPAGSTIIIDILSFFPAVPLLGNSYPYQIIPFLFTVVEADSKGAIIKQIQHFSEAGSDDRAKLFDLLKTTFAENNEVYIFNRQKLTSILKQNKMFLPDNFQTKMDHVIVKEIKSVFDDMAYYNPVSGFNSDEVIVSNKLSLKRGNKPVFSSEIVAGDAYQSLFYSNDIFETLEIKENLLAYSLQRAIAVRDLIHLLRAKIQS